MAQFNIGVSHSRSLTQPTFPWNNLPPLSPYPPTESSMVSSNSNLKDLYVEEIDVSSRGSKIAPPVKRENLIGGNASLPMHRGYQHSYSDVALGFSAMIQSSPQLVPISGPGTFERPAVYINDTCGNDTANYFNSIVEGTGDRNPESEIVDDLFNSMLDLEQMVSMEFTSAEDKDKDSIITKSQTVSRHDLSFGHGEFNEFELKKIMEDERLEEIATSDPKRAKRILANRQSAARSKERKLRYIMQLEYKVQTLQTEANALSAQVPVLQKDYVELTNQNNELKFRFHAMERQAQLREALHETLMAEVQRLKLANMELRQEGAYNGNNKQQLSMKLHMFPVQRQLSNQMERLSVAPSTA